MNGEQKVGEDLKEDGEGSMEGERSECYYIYR